ncbi:hypothetical protein [Alteribacillus sp. HJP-4]|uniref:hypothetical protein n=1 Tax=Alteribacillus sp. HJP-4 TaxID=2775394 RepID=UPI0035CD0650
MRVNVPKDKGLDHSLALWREGYEFIPNRVQKHHFDVYETKVLGERTALLSGEAGARLFYNTNRMQRSGALLPNFVLKTLFGENAIQTMDDTAHEHRKLLFMSLMTAEALERLSEITTKHWEDFTAKGKKDIVLYEEASKILTRTACEWAGVPILEKEVPMRTRDFLLMIDGFGVLGLKHLESRRARSRTEKWIERLILDVRAGKLQVEKGTAIYEMSSHRDHQNKLLNPRMAAIELNSLIQCARPSRSQNLLHLVRQHWKNTRKLKPAFLRETKS